MSTNEKYGWVNALRGYAILLVMLIHSSQTFSVYSFAKIISSSGDLGVQLFFIVSSFTLFNSYSNRKNKEEKHLKRKFFIRRFFRIAPYYYIAGLLYVSYRIIIKNEFINIKNLIANYTFTNGIYLPGINDIPPGGWSIGVEMLFYLLVPILFKYVVSIKKAVILFVVTVFFSILVNHIYINYTTNILNQIFEEINKWSLYLWLPNQLPIFILGIILYFIYKKNSVSLKTGQLLLLFSIFAFFILPFYSFNTVYPFFIKREYVYGIVFVCFAIGVYTTKNKFIINDFIQKLGVVSFSMYLNHFLILYILGYLYTGTIKFMFVYHNFTEIILRNNIVFFISYIVVIFFSYSISKYTYQKIEIKGIGLGTILS